MLIPSSGCSANQLTGESYAWLTANMAARARARGPATSVPVGPDRDRPLPNAALARSPAVGAPCHTGGHYVAGRLDRPPVGRRATEPLFPASTECRIDLAGGVADDAA